MPKTSATVARLTAAQRKTLAIAALGEISTPATGMYDLGTWRVAGPRGRAVTTVARTLIERGLARPSERVADNRRPLVVTADGYEALSAAGRRAR